MKFSQEQSEAIQTRNKNLLVSASAGSGKTSVLVERIIELCLNEKVDINQFLVVTFTNAAAAEMRERISKRFMEKKATSRDVGFINRQLSLLQNANISTLHSFCNNVIRSNFFAVDIDPNFKIADDKNKSMLKMQAVENVLHHYYATLNQNRGLAKSEAQEDEIIEGAVLQQEEMLAFHDFLENYFSYKSDDKLKSTIFAIYEYSMSQPYPVKWLKSGGIFDLPIFYRQILGNFAQDLRIWINDLQFCLLLCHEGSGLQKYEPAFLSDYRKFYDILLRVESFLERYRGVYNEDIDLREFEVQCDSLIKYIQESKSHEELGRGVKKDADKELREYVKKIREIIKESFANYSENFFAYDYAQNQYRLDKIRPYISILSKLAMDYHREFSRLKKEAKLLDFNDLEHYCIEILKEDEIASSYKNSIKYIFIDEYQDTNAVQEEIANLIKSGDNLFFVGDVKQSIYGFRSADPQIFLEKFDLYAHGGSNHRIDLNGNYRSSPTILQGVNHIFEILMSRDFGGIDYRESSMLIAKNESFEIQSKPVVHLITPNDKKVDLVELEANFIADRIAEILKNEIYDPKISKRRKPNLNDIVILMRNLKKDAKTIQNVLLKRGYASMTSEYSSFFDIPELVNIINLLRVIDNPYDDIALLSVMRSLFGGFDDTDLAMIKLEAKEEFFYDCIRKFIHLFKGRQGDEKASEEEPQSERASARRNLAEKLADFIQKVQGYRNRNDRKLSDFINRILKEHHYKYFVSALSNGSVRWQYIQGFLRNIAEYEEQNSPQLHHFIEYIDDIKDSQISYGVAENSTNSAQKIRIMSIHKSKGLEFPIVFMPLLDKGFNKIDLKENILFDKNINISMKYLNRREYEKSSNVVFEYVKWHKNRKLVEEEQRLLYVAFTRAVNVLECIVSFADEEKLNKFYTLHDNKFYQRKYLGTELQEDYEKYRLYEPGSRFCPLSKIKKSNHFASFLCNCIDFENDFWELKTHVLSYEKEDSAQERRIKTLSDVIKQYKIGEYSSYDRKYQRVFNKMGVSSFAKHKKNQVFEMMSEENMSQGKVADVKEMIDLDDSYDMEKSFEILIKDEDVQVSDKGFSEEAVVRGNAYHHICEVLIKELLCTSFASKPVSSGEMNSLLGQFVTRGQITEEELRYVDVNKIWKMSCSEFFKELENADVVYAEKDFVYRYVENSSSEEILLQGIVDLMYVKDDKIYIVDYKTDRAFNEDIFLQRYTEQLSLYGLALGDILGKEVASKILYSFELDKSIVIE